MTEKSLVILLAALAAVLGIVATVLFYLFASKRRGLTEALGDDSGDEDEAASEGSRLRRRGTEEGAGRGVREFHKKTSMEKSQRYLFVMFDAPGPETNRALGELLTATNAFYESELGIYHLPRGPEGYPLTVANAFSPGTLPPLHKAGDHEPVKGISVLIKFLHARRIAHSPETLIKFVNAAAQLGGHVLDFDRKPVTDETFTILRREAEASSA